MSCLYREVGAKDSAAASAHCPDHWGDDGNCSAAPRRLVRQLVCNRTDGGELSLSSPAPSGSDQGPPGPATGLDLDLARLGGVTLNMAQEAPADLGFRFGVNPVTGLTVNFSSVVEIIKAEFLSALGPGTMVAFFAVGGWKREDEEEDITS